MPFHSQAQRRWMYANEPEMARRWEAHTPKDRHLPERKRPRKRKAMDGSRKKTAMEFLGLVKEAVGARSRFLSRLLLPTTASGRQVNSLGRRISTILPTNDPAAIASLPGLLPGVTKDSVRDLIERRGTMLQIGNPPRGLASLGLLPPPAKELEITLNPKLNRFLTSQQDRFFDKYVGDLDRLAVSGRHGGPFLLTQRNTPSQVASGRPVWSYRGYHSDPTIVNSYTSKSPLPIAGGLPADILPPRGDAVWFSGDPYSAQGYAKATVPRLSLAFPDPPVPIPIRSYVMRVPTQELRRAGPHSPRFHPHLRRDTRRLSTSELDELEASTRSSRPYPHFGPYPYFDLPSYESVFTSPGQLDRRLVAYYKQLPSGRDFQQVTHSRWKDVLGLRKATS